VPTSSDPRLPDLFARASEMEGDARAAWLADLRRAEPGLAREVEELLASAAAGEGRFETPAWEWRTTGGEQDDAPPPASIGPFRIVREIGRGGMGRVFLAEQETENFRRKVALKIVDRPGAGEEGARRFREEARILAALEHPGIARFYDAGWTDGRSYMALEYVEGEHLLAFAARQGLDTRQRVEVFLQILDAVDFAHRRLVVHRDLKPGNILVDAGGAAKLLDFGISKMVDPETAIDPTHTETRAFTPAYASPEQVRGERVTVASDVYSLGVVLYELLAGCRPLERGTEESDPRPPSSAARRMDTTGGPRETTTTRWRDLTGDLDAITLKALRGEVESRYASAAAFAADLRRWLDGKPVEARRGGRRYRMAKFTRRHRVPVLFAVLAIMALVAGVTGILVQSRHAARAAAIARAQRDFALRQISRAEAINDLNAFLLSDIAPGGRQFAVGDLLGQAERILDHARGRTDPNRAELLVAIGRQYHTLEKTDKAMHLLTEAYELSRGTPEHDTAARAACALASTLANAEEMDRAASLFQEGMDQLPDEPQFVLSRVFCLLRGSEVSRSAGRADEAVTRIEAAARLLRESGQGSALLSLRAEMDLAESYRHAGRLRQADEAFGNAWTSLEAMGRGDTGSAGTLLNNWALVQRALGRPLEAERSFRRAVDISSVDASATGVSPLLLNNLARTLMDLGRLDEAREIADRASVLAERAGHKFTITQSLFLRNLISLRLGDLPHAASLLAEMETRVRPLPEGHPYHPIFAVQQAMLEQARGNEEGARAAYDRAVTLADPAARFVVHLRRSEFRLATRSPVEAAADAAQALAEAQKDAEQGALSSRIGLANLALARALRDLGKSADARAAAAAAVEHLDPTVGADHAAARAARELAGEAGRSPE
jgi:eukaryotic-like serine/threonine-protein kinase